MVYRDVEKIEKSCHMAPVPPSLYLAMCYRDDTFIFHKTGTASHVARESSMASVLFMIGAVLRCLDMANKGKVHQEARILHLLF
jgi:hypothetical protein